MKFSAALNTPTITFNVLYLIAKVATNVYNNSKHFPNLCDLYNIWVWQLGYILWILQVIDLRLFQVFVICFVI